MNAVELFDIEGINWWRCSKCNNIYAVAEVAEKCCAPKVCSDCGIEISNWFVRCGDCQEKYRFNKAKKVDIYEYIFVGDDYFEDAEELIEHCLDNEIDIPEYAWVADVHYGFDHTSPEHIVESIIERVTDEMFDDVDNYIKGQPELLEAVKTFFKANECIISFYPNYNKVYMLPTDMIEKIKKEYDERGY